MAHSPERRTTHSCTCRIYAYFEGEALAMRMTGQWAQICPSRIIFIHLTLQLSWGKIHLWSKITRLKHPEVHSWSSTPYGECSSEHSSAICQHWFTSLWAEMEIPMHTCRCLNVGVLFCELNVNCPAEAKPWELHQSVVAINLILLFSWLQTYVCPYLHQPELMDTIC